MVAPARLAFRFARRPSSDAADRALSRKAGFGRMKPRVVYWNNIPAPYMVERFNALADRGNVDLEAWFSTRTESDRSWQVAEDSWRFPYRYLPTIPGPRPFTIPVPAFRARPDLLVSLYALPSFVLGSSAARLRGIRIAYWVEVTFDAWITRKQWKERLKSALLPRADGILTAARDGAAFAMRYAVSPDRIFMVPHVIDYERYSNGSAQLRPARETIRARLGLRGVTFAYVGRLWSGKGRDQLLDAFALLRRKDGDVSLLLVGTASTRSGCDSDVPTRASRAWCSPAFTTATRCSLSKRLRTHSSFLPWAIPSGWSCSRRWPAGSLSSPRAPRARSPTGSTKG
jgi:glycosyltransferase involved in cell wall biosynthesis